MENEFEYLSDRGGHGGHLADHGRCYGNHSNEVHKIWKSVSLLP